MKSKYIYIFSRKKYFKNYPEEAKNEKACIDLFGSSWQKNCDGKEVTQTDDEKGICRAREFDIFPYFIRLKDCIKKKVE